MLSKKFIQFSSTFLLSSGVFAASTLTLINANSNSPQPLSGISGSSAVLAENAILYLGSVGQALNVRADFSGVGSVKFNYDGNANYRTESTAPYALASDSGGDYDSWTPTVGSHTIIATAYSGGGGTGSVVGSTTIHFSVQSGVAPAPAPVGPSITSVDLINANSDVAQPLDGVAGHSSLLVDGAVIDLAKVGKALNLNAKVSGASSVKFGLDANASYRTEGVAPYALESDSGGDYASWTPSLGAHTVTLTPYSGTTAGVAKVIKFKVVDSTVVVPPTAPAGPAVTSIELINASTDLPQPLDGIAGHSSVLVDGAVFDLAKVGAALNLNAKVSGATSVKFGYDANASYRTEGVAPFAFESDTGGDYASWTPSVGAHTVTITPYSGTTAGVAKVIKFTVSNSTVVVVTPPTNPVPPTSPVGTLPGNPASTAEPASYSGPIVITKGGTYTGNWQSMNMDVPAVTVKTSEAVIIENCHVSGNSDLIFTPWSYVHLTVRNCSFHGKAPNQSGRSRGKAINAQRYKNLVVENNYFENTGAGVFSNEYSGDGSLNETLTIRYNRVRNLNGSWSDGVNKTWIQFVQSANYIQPEGNPRGAVIAWNEVINTWGQSVSEDLINFYQAGGRSDSPFKVHNNFLRGSYPNSTYASGSGIQVDGKDHNKTAWIDIYENTVMDTLNGGMGMAAGSNVHMHNNRIISSGKSPDGKWMAGNNAGVWIFDYYKTSAVGTMYNNIIDNNVIGWASEFSYNRTPFPNRLDYSESFNLGGGIKNNLLLPDAPITAAIEEAEYQTFLAKVKVNNIKLGPQMP